MKSLAVLVALLLPISAHAGGVVPLGITGVSIQARINHSSGPGLVGPLGTDFSSAAGTLVSPLSSRLSTDVTFTAQVAGDRIAFTLDGIVTENSGAVTGLDFKVDVTLGILVPDVGDAVTPVYSDFENLVIGGIMTEALEAEASIVEVSSGLLGDMIFRASSPFPNPFVFLGESIQGIDPVQMTLLPGGDSVQISLHLTGSWLIAGLGAYSSSGEFRFQTATPTIGTGDMNGDSNVDILDSTILRRLLAGLPLQ